MKSCLANKLFAKYEFFFDIFDFFNLLEINSTYKIGQLFAESWSKWPILRLEIWKFGYHEPKCIDTHRKNDSICKEKFEIFKIGKIQYWHWRIFVYFILWFLVISLKNDNRKKIACYIILLNNVNSTFYKKFIHSTSCQSKLEWFLYVFKGSFIIFHINQVFQVFAPACWEGFVLLKVLYLKPEIIRLTCRYQ